MNEHADVTNSELACYTPANITVSGGYLAETAMAQTATCLNGMGAPAGPAGGMLTEMYTSGAIQMKSFSFLYGTVEVRAKFSGGTGTWPAVWMLGAYCQYPTWLYGVNSHGVSGNPCKWHDPGSDEIDIAEIFSGAGTVNQTIQGDNGCQPAPPSGTPQDWHVYTLNWTSTSVTWAIDGVTGCTLTANVPAYPMFLIINTTVGGVGGGTPDPSTLPQTTSIDYVHVTTSNVATM
jgi:beta-glucanase (GH16 family)